MLTAQPPCKRSMWDKGYVKCACPIMIPRLEKIQVKATQPGYFQPKEYAAVIDATFSTIR